MLSSLSPLEQGAGAAAGEVLALPKPLGNQRVGAQLGPRVTGWPRQSLRPRVQHSGEQLPPTHLTEPAPWYPRPRFQRPEGSLAARPPQPRGPARVLQSTRGAAPFHLNGTTAAGTRTSAGHPQVQGACDIIL